VVDQWGLVAVGLMAVRSGNANPPRCLPAVNGNI
jgi:hypothetical protein